ncbi:hypothetical protein F7725_007652 [Dissostichus mawsoni]|uniref:Transposase Helix-turn-helix domain-containing protein n=1 Tax=Dissostichus mawsoni TaxID=36200 RepID=A0A7J5Y708_DISMA|nr:hypothetical protein F7725_007652 [Dissostichus mawsoni]
MIKVRRDNFCPTKNPMVESPTPDLTAEYKVETVAPPDHDYCLTPATAVMANQVADENEALKIQIRELQLRLEMLQLRTPFGIQRLAGFATYKHFHAFWKLVEPAANTKMARISNASASSSDFSQPTTTTSEDGSCVILCLHFSHSLFPFLRVQHMHLSVGLHLRDLAERFGIHHTTVSRIISTWTHFLYQQLGCKHLWIPRKVVRAHLPPEFSAFPDTKRTTGKSMGKPGQQ